MSVTDNNAYPFGNTPLHAAAEGGVVHAVIALLDGGAQVDSKNSMGKTPLMIAFERGHERCVLAILKYVADVNHRDKRGKTALHCAAHRGMREAVSYILDRGADVNAVDNERKSPLEIAFEQGSERIVSDIISHGADVNFKYDSGKTPLHYAAQRSMPHAALTLIELGAKVNSKDVTGRTPLHYISAVKDENDVVGRRRGDGDEAFLWDEFGNKLLNVSAEKGHCIVASVLLQHDAEVDCKDRLGKTALYVAAENGRVDVVKALLKYGADVNVRVGVFPNYSTALKCAEQRFANRMCFQVLQNHIIMLSSLRFPIHELNLNLIDFNSVAVQNYKANCERDLERLKNEPLKKGHKQISFYDVLTNDRKASQMSLNFGNRSFSDNFTTLGWKFSRGLSPIFGNLIAFRMCWNYVRRSLLQETTTILGEMFSVPPGICVDEITQHLSNHDLKNFVTACQSTN